MNWLVGAPVWQLDLVLFLSLVILGVIYATRRKNRKTVEEDET